MRDLGDSKWIEKEPLDLIVLCLGELLVVVRGLVLKEPFVPLLTLDPRSRWSVEQPKKLIHVASVDLRSDRLSSVVLWMTDVSKGLQEGHLAEIS